MPNMSMPSVDRVRLTFLVEDTVNKRNLVAKHGLSILVETISADSKSKILVDAGPPPDVAVHNANMMKVDIHNLDAIVITHGHYDHAGGLVQILRSIGRPTLVVAHPLAFAPKFAYRPNLKFVGTEFNQESIKNVGGVLLIARNSLPIATGVIASGEIPRETDFETVEGFWTITNDHFCQDTMPDDQSVVVNVREKGLVVISGCAHAGIINTVKNAQEIAGTEEVYTIVGGFHLADASTKRIEATLDHLLRIQPKLLHPCHCTGARAMSRFLEAFRERVVPVGTGYIIDL
jgi:7,8-dihydropterin-6-yl-methyl-4-(beta-D-ribofuranosyl)aminobenzene 5'-phosphate synthase